MSGSSGSIATDDAELVRLRACADEPAERSPRRFVGTQSPSSAYTQAGSQSSIEESGGLGELASELSSLLEKAQVLEERLRAA